MMRSKKNKHADIGMPSVRETWAFACAGLAITAVCLFVFSTYPNLDLDIARSYTDATSEFYLMHDQTISFFRKTVLFLIFGFYVVVIGAWVDAYNKQQPVLGQEWHRWSFLGMSALFGPVLIVNVIFKGNWGRARPQFLEEFGGTLDFTPFYVWSDQCLDNCSFSSGEVAAVSMIFLSLAFILKPKPRLIVLFLGFAFTCIIAWKRIAIGAHFLSDTIMSVALMTLSTVFVYWLFYLRPGGWIDWFDQKQKEKLAAADQSAE